MKGTGPTEMVIIRMGGRPGHEASSANGMSSLPTGAHATAKKATVERFNLSPEPRPQSFSPLLSAKKSSVPDGNTGAKTEPQIPCNGPDSH